jgi:hypothetical protein
MTVQSKLIEIVRLLEQELQDLRAENTHLIKRAEDAEFRIKQVTEFRVKQIKPVETVTATMPVPEGWTYLSTEPTTWPFPTGEYAPTMAPLSPLDIYTYTNQPKYEPVTNGTDCAVCGIKVEGVIGHVCTRPVCPTGLNYGYAKND